MAVTTPLQFYASATSVGGDNVASIIIPTAGRIAAVTVAFRAATTCAGSKVEVSLQSTNQFTTNDSRNVLLSWAGYQDFAMFFNSPTWIPMDVPVTEMDRVYIHVAVTSGLWLVVGNVWLRH